MPTSDEPRVHPTSDQPAVRPAPGEPAVRGWRPVRVDELARRLLARRPADAARPCLVAVDGRSAGGKTTVAQALAAAVPGRRGLVVHTDDLAWHEPFFGWGHLLLALLDEVRAGGAVRFRPPAWERRGRPGAVEVPAGLDLVVVEGVGANQREAAGRYDAAVWVQSDDEVARRRGIERDVASGVNGDRAQATAFWGEWDSHERPFLAADRPWERATWIVLGTPAEPAAPGDVLVVRGPLRA